MSPARIISTLSIRASLGGLVLGTASFLAITDRIDGPSYLGLALLVAGFFFKGDDAKKE